MLASTLSISFLSFLLSSRRLTAFLSELLLQLLRDLYSCVACVPLSLSSLCPSLLKGTQSHLDTISTPLMFRLGNGVISPENDMKKCFWHERSGAEDPKNLYPEE